MIIHPTRPQLVLWEVTDAAAPAPVQAIFDWARSYLSRPHPELGRPGPMCPYVPSALRSQLMWVAVQPGVPEDPAAVATSVGAYRQWFAELEPRTGPEAEMRTLLVLFPDLPRAAVPDLIDGTQATLKPDFVADGLMIGQFHPTPPDQPGLWNPDFRPLHSPVPLLAMRAMVPSDLPFLVDDRDLFASYVRRFGEAVPARCRAQYDATAAQFRLARAAVGALSRTVSSLPASA